MKITILLTSVGLTLLLLGTTVLGVSRGEAVAEKISEAYFTDSIDEYTGQVIEIGTEQCAPITSQIRQRLSNSPATKKLTELDAEFEETFQEGAPTASSYLWLRDSGLVDELEIGAYATVTELQSSLREYLNFDPDAVVADLMLAESEKSLAEEKRKLERANRLPPSVSTSRWGASHLAEWNKTCGTAASAIKDAESTEFVNSALEFSRSLETAVNATWESDGYDKVSALVAYSSRDGASCGGYNSCATFWLEAAAPCEVTLLVEFTDDDGKLEDLVAESVTITKANSRKAVVVPGGPGGGFYEILEASCN